MGAAFGLNNVSISWRRPQAHRYLGLVGADGAQHFTLIVYPSLRTGARAPTVGCEGVVFVCGDGVGR